jgi:hypothetical protein
LAAVVSFTSVNWASTPSGKAVKYLKTKQFACESLHLLYGRALTCTWTILVTLNGHNPCPHHCEKKALLAQVLAFRPSSLAFCSLKTVMAIMCLVGTTKYISVVEGRHQ